MHEVGSRFIKIWTKEKIKGRDMKKDSKTAKVNI